MQHTDTSMVRSFTLTAERHLKHISKFASRLGSPLTRPWLDISMDQLHDIRVPAGVAEGQTFQIMIAGALMSVTCPPGVGSGDVIQVRMDGLAKWGC
eukprot:scaffold3741_cov114-Isochrysis_galbana.AAC.2